MDWNDMLADYDGMRLNISIALLSLYALQSLYLLLLVFLALLVAHEQWRQSTSWGDMVEEEPSRPPGHGIHMHEKLSSPSRKRYYIYVAVFVFL